MEQPFCQSCSMPLDNPSLRGTEKDGTSSKDYCCFCYHNGVFTSPDLTIDTLKADMQQRMAAEKIPAELIRAAINRLPQLKRWKKE